MKLTITMRDTLHVEITDGYLTGHVGKVPLGGIVLPESAPLFDQHTVLAWTTLAALPCAFKLTEGHLPPDVQEALLTVARWVQRGGVK